MVSTDKGFCLFLKAGRVTGRGFFDPTRAFFVSFPFVLFGESSIEKLVMVLVDKVVCYFVEFRWEDVLTRGRQGKDGVYPFSVSTGR